MIGMGTTQTTTTTDIDYSRVMSPFAATVFAVMLGAFAIMLVGGITTFIVLVTRHYMGL
jgi:hypothetical protein